MFFAISATNVCSSRSRITGKERDTESGLDDFGARYYASSIGRMMTPDPHTGTLLHMLNPQRWNMYAYALNNPLLFTDPTGMDAIAVNFSGDVGGLGHMGIISVHPDGTATYSRFGPVKGGSPIDVGQVRTDRDLPKVDFGQNGLPTDASYQALTDAVGKFEGDYQGKVPMAYFKTSDAETGNLDAYINAAQAASDARRLTYLGFPAGNCATYCAIGLHRAGANRGAVGALNIFSAIPNVYYWWLQLWANQIHEEVTHRIID